MRYAILSDIHSNKQALNVVLADIKVQQIDRIVCLGDIVGYGPSPMETIEICFQNVNYFILGNHDAAAAGKIATDNFNDNAKFLIDWTISHIEDGHKKFLASNPLMLKGKDFRCSHGSLKSPGRFLYILSEDDAREEFEAFPEQIAFVGHSHVPGIYVIGASGNPHWLNPTNFNIEEGKRYIVNVGSIGQPRDDDFRASYCIYDEEKGDVLFRKLPFDIESYRRELAKANIPEKSSYFLEFYLTRTSKPLRDIIAFKELSISQAIVGVEEIRSLEGEIKRLRKSKTIISLVAICLFLLSIILFLIYFKTEKEKKLMQKKAENAVELLSKKTKTIIKNRDTSCIEKYFVDEELISMPFHQQKITPSTPLNDWIIELSSPEKQAVFVDSYEDKKQGTFFVIRILSESPDEILIKYRPVKVSKGQRFSASAQFKKNFLQKGDISLLLILEKNDGIFRVLGINTPDEIKDNDTWTRRTSITLGKDNVIPEDGLLYFAIKGNFEGEILVRKCSLIEKK